MILNRTLTLSLLIILTNLSPVHSQNFTPRGIGGGGALFFPTFNPTNDNEFYVSCDMSELFHSTDNGNNYDQIHFSKLQVFNTSTYEFTLDSNIAYCTFNDGNQGYPVKTSDGGNTWNRINAYDVNNYGNVYKMAANYYNPDQLIIGAYGDILFSNDGGLNFSLVKHATNMGAGIIFGGVFWDGAYIYIGTNEGIYYSSNFGGSFNPMSTTGIASGQVIWNFAGSRSNNNSRMVCITANTSGTYNGIMPWDYNNFAQEVYVMDNSNGVWIPKSSGINFTNDFIMYVGMAKNDIDNLYIAGSDNSLNAPMVLKTDNGGNSWNKIFNTTNNSNVITGWEGYQGDKNWSWSETCFGISVSPFNSNKVIFSTYSNVQISNDGGNNWKQAYVNNSDQHPAGSPTPTRQYYHGIGLENTTCWQVHFQNANTMMGCYSDIGGIRSTDAGASWGFDYSGFSVNSLYRIVSTSSGTMYGACSKIHDMYQSTRLTDALLDAIDNTGKIIFSTDDGANWNTLHTFSHPVFWLAIDPSDSNTMYASVIHYGGTPGSQLGGIYVTHDLSNGAASIWTKLPNPTRTEGHPASIEVLKDGKMVCTFSGSRNSSGAFTASSGVFYYDPLVNSWTDVSDPGMYYWTKDIVIDPNDSTQNTWYVCVFSGWGGAPNGLGGLYRTTDRGLNWTKLTATQFDRVTSLTFNPLHLNEAYLTTETQGLWFSSDMTATIPNWTIVQTYPFRQPERVFFNPFNPTEMWVTSFGNGIKFANMMTTSVENPSNEKDQLVIFPNPGNSNIHFENESLTLGGKIIVTDVWGRPVITKDFDGKDCLIDCSNWAKGLYFVNYKKQTLKLIIQ